MKWCPLVAILCLAGCGREAPENQTAAMPVNGAAVGTEAPASAPQLIPRPKDQAQLDRLILAGYTPHADHLHAPGVDECPMSKGSDAVM